MITVFLALAFQSSPRLTKGSLVAPSPFGPAPQQEKVRPREAREAAFPAIPLGVATAAPLLIASEFTDC